jgi:hypothetical protein
MHSGSSESFVYLGGKFNDITFIIATTELKRKETEKVQELFDGKITKGN